MVEGTPYPFAGRGSSTRPDRGLSAHLGSGTLRMTPTPGRLMVPTESRPVGTIVLCA